MGAGGMIDPTGPETGKLRKRGQPLAGHAASRRDAAMPVASSPLEEWIARIVSAGCGVPVAGVEQARNPFPGRNTSGVATYTLGTGERRSLFWKMGAAHGDEAGLRLGCVGNEVAAYLSIGKVADAPAPALIGGEIRETDALLVIEHAGSTRRIHKSPQVGVLLERAASRIGTFHRRASAAIPDGSLERYDARMFGIWASRAAGRLPDVPWFRRVSGAFPSLAATLQATSRTVIHGELYPCNVLVSTDAITAVDWEWAGLGMGEIDLAALTEGHWAESTVCTCAAAYAESRRMHAADKLFRQRLAASRLYLHMRWFGWGTKPRPMGKKARWRLEQVHALAAELGIL
jgi:hypothetical protein